MTRPRLGDPVEVPWWVAVGAVPPLAVIVGGLVGPGNAGARLAGVAASLAMVAVLVAVPRRVPSRNLQSVWISAAYAVWFFAALLWGVAAYRG